MLKLTEHSLFAATPLTVEHTIATYRGVDNQATCHNDTVLDQAQANVAVVIRVENHRMKRTSLSIQIGSARREPQVDVDRSGICVDLYTFQAAVIFVGPHLYQLV